MPAPTPLPAPLPPELGFWHKHDSWLRRSPLLSCPEVPAQQGPAHPCAGLWAQSPCLGAAELTPLVCRTRVGSGLRFCQARLRHELPSAPKPLPLPLPPSLLLSSSLVLSWLILGCAGAVELCSLTSAFWPDHIYLTSGVLAGGGCSPATPPAPDVPGVHLQKAFSSGEESSAGAGMNRRSKREQPPANPSALPGCGPSSSQGLLCWNLGTGTQRLSLDLAAATGLCSPWVCLWCQPTEQLRGSSSVPGCHRIPNPSPCGPGEAGV